MDAIIRWGGRHEGGPQRVGEGGGAGTRGNERVEVRDGVEWVPTPLLSDHLTTIPHLNPLIAPGAGAPSLADALGASLASSPPIVDRRSPASR
ncbi:hypothetical protein CONPUDRAFT_156111 [Coniophora puteana RWD-64-598 SS2]|uniref:Uncharacterized protein n=1 Tax=Coniophora puteana (strain RWD-64-598) TaxID=741705 RepID=A0A5M3MHJ7_CONPW|nr:uncharacterized protein CONPUDRAFT_156111 [Coniophora puteana RWD-64-598 SS2]EIW78101.1 hypothetical protein CONPUDRAFT_156111 [Coniophora puteana RWD-64-598 SS2]